MPGGGLGEELAEASVEVGVEAGVKMEEGEEEEEGGEEISNTIFCCMTLALIWAIRSLAACESSSLPATSLLTPDAGPPSTFSCFSTTGSFILHRSI